MLIERDGMLDLSTLVDGLRLLLEQDKRAKYYLMDDSLIVKTIVKPNNIPPQTFELLSELGFVCEDFDGSWIIYT